MPRDLISLLQKFAQENVQISDSETVHLQTREIRQNTNQIVSFWEKKKRGGQFLITLKQHKLDKSSAITVTAL